MLGVLSWDGVVGYWARLSGLGSLPPAYGTGMGGGVRAGLQMSLVVRSVYCCC